MKKILFIIATVLLSLSLIGCTSEKKPVKKVEVKKETKYRIVSDYLGDNGKDVVLNANSDSPTTKRLFKIPSGTYEVSTTTNKFATFFIVKDKIILEKEDKYPESLDYVSNQYILTNGSNDLNGTAKKSVIITLNDDESINTQLNGSYYVLIFKKQ